MFTPAYDLQGQLRPELDDQQTQGKRSLLETCDLCYCHGPTARRLTNHCLPRDSNAHRDTTDTATRWSLPAAPAFPKLRGEDGGEGQQAVAVSPLCSRTSGKAPGAHSGHTGRHPGEDLLGWAFGHTLLHTCEFSHWPPPEQSQVTPWGGSCICAALLSSLEEGSPHNTQPEDMNDPRTFHLTLLDLGRKK